MPGCPSGFTEHARRRARLRHIPPTIIEQVYGDPDYRRPSERASDREVSGRAYDDLVIEIVVDVVDGSVVTVWATRVAP